MGTDTIFFFFLIKTVIAFLVVANENSLKTTLLGNCQFLVELRIKKNRFVRNWKKTIEFEVAFRFGNVFNIY